MTDSQPSPSFLARHEFLIRRLHSLSGLIPVGAYMVVHLLTNASVLAGAATFQANVDRIHSLGPILPLVEWTFIFIPILFHAILGVAFIWGAVPNTSDYPYSSNIRYMLQRATGMIAFAFIAFHIWHLHKYGEPFGGGAFDPHHATSTAGTAIQSALWIQLAYAVGVLACVYHLANGIWTMGITWGVWTSSEAQRKASYACGGFGVLLAVVGLAALSGFRMVDVEEAAAVEDRLETHRKIAEGEVAWGEEESTEEGSETSGDSPDVSSP